MAPISTPCQGQARGGTRPKGLQVTALSPPTPKPRQALAAPPCLYLLLLPHGTQRETCLARHASPTRARWAAGRGWHHQPGPRQPLSIQPEAIPLPFGQGKGSEPAAPCSVSLSLCQQNGFAGDQVLQRLQDWLGKLSLCSVICRSSKKTKQTERERKKQTKKSTLGK